MRLTWRPSLDIASSIWFQTLCLSMSHAASRFNSDGLQQKTWLSLQGTASFRVHHDLPWLPRHQQHEHFVSLFFIFCPLRFSPDLLALKFIACLTHDIPGISSLSALIPARRTLPQTRRPMSNGQNILFISIDLVRTCLLSSTGLSRIWRREVECMKYRRREARLNRRVWGLCRCSRTRLQRRCPRARPLHRWTRTWSDLRHFSGLHCIAISCTNLGCWLSAYLLPEVGMRPVIILNFQKSLRILGWRGNVGWVLRFWSLPLRWDLQLGLELG